MTDIILMLFSQSVPLAQGFKQVAHTPHSTLEDIVWPATTYFH